MPRLTSQQASDLANQFLALAQTIGDFRYRRWNELSKAQHHQLASQHWSVLNYGEDVLSLSTVLVMDDVSNSLSAIKAVTGKIKATLERLDDIQQGIDTAAVMVTLGAAIISRNPLAIGGAIKGLVDGWKA
jgi:hypothetical protein